MCVRVATEALGRVDLLDGLVAVAVDEVEYKKGQRDLEGDPLGGPVAMRLLVG